MEKTVVRRALLDFNQAYIYNLETRDIFKAPDAERKPQFGDIYLPSMSLKDFGDPSFIEEYKLEAPLLAGSMAHGISSTRFVEHLSRAGLLSFFGAAGLDLATVEAAIHRLQNLSKLKSFGLSLVHLPQDPAKEKALVELYLKRDISVVEASAFMSITPALVKLRVKGLRLSPSGQILGGKRIIAKVSRAELATKFFSPPSTQILDELVRQGEITPEEAMLALQIPLAQDICAEADSGGHTDGRPIFSLLPGLLRLRDRCQERHNKDWNLRVGAAGGIATPESAAAAFTMGAAFILTGSINQCTVEAGTSPEAKRLLAEAQETDIAMSPSASHFEMGIRVQVLKRGILFPMRAQRLYEIYRSRNDIEELSESERTFLEKQIFAKSLEAAWDEATAYLKSHSPSQLKRAEFDPRHKLALLCKSYLGQSALWAQQGLPERQADYQIWCGPAMGALNQWLRGTPLERPESRQVVKINLNILKGCALLMRANFLRHAGAPIPRNMGEWIPALDP